MTTTKEFSDRIGRSIGMASRILTGKRAPGLRLIRNINREFGVPLDDMVRTQPDPEAFARVVRKHL